MMNTPLLADTECRHMDYVPASQCALCRAEAGYRPGTDRQQNDCSIVALVTLTGASYAEAEVLLADAGKRGGRGALTDHLITALAAAGFTATRTRAVDRSGSYLVAAWSGKSGHAFAVVDGRPVNAGRYLRARRQLAWKID